MGQRFSQDIIDAYSAGVDIKRKKRLEAEAIEDRDVHKKVLAHQLKTLKLEDEIKARKAAVENLDLLSGIPEADTPPEMLEDFNPEQVNNGLATVPESIEPYHRQMKHVEIPGVSELGVPGVRRRPMTMEGQLQKLLEESRIKAETTPFNLADGAQRFMGGRLMAENPRDARPQAPPQPVKLTDRAPDGTETDRFVPGGDALLGASATRSRLPWRPRASGGSGGGGSQSLTPDEMNANVEAIMSGRGLPVIPNSALGLKLKAALEKKHFDISKAFREHTAAVTALRTLSSGRRVEIQTQAEAAMQALQDLEEKNAAFKGTGATWATFPGFKSGAFGADGQKKANELQEAVTQVQNRLTTIGTLQGMSSSKALEAASKRIQADLSQGRLDTTIQGIKSELGYTTAAIRSASDALIAGGDMGNQAPPPDEQANNTNFGKTAPTAAQVKAKLTEQGRANDPATVRKVMANPEAVRVLFGGK